MMYERLFPRSGAGGQDIAVLCAGCFYRVQLVPIQLERLRWLAGWLALDRKDLLTRPVKQILRHHIRDGRSRLKGRIKLDERIRPQGTFTELSLHRLANPFVADVDEAPNVRSVVVDEPFPKVEYVHVPVTPSSSQNCRYPPPLEVLRWRSDLRPGEPWLSCARNLSKSV